MKILAIETSCDETAIAILECSGDPRTVAVSFDVLANIVLSQVALHAEYGGVFPMLAKREHSRNLVPVLKQALEKAVHKGEKRQGAKDKGNIPDTQYTILDTVLVREPELLAQLKPFLESTERPDIDAVAVTYGPGLEPALWVGVNFAKALALVWDVPIVPVNHMEGHLFSALFSKSAEKNFEFRILNLEFPILALLVSGGHTELVLSRDWLEYEIIGETRDDAAGEAFDKVARMLGLSYPGGPAIALEAEKFLRHSASSLRSSASHRFPRPMLESDGYDFSFSGLKTAVLYQLKKIPKLTPDIIQEFAYEFQEAVAEVLVTKTIKAAQEHGARAVLLGGGVSANTRLKEVLEEKITAELDDVAFSPAPREFTGDNAVMIGVAAYLRHLCAPRKYAPEEICADGTLRLGKQ